LLPIVTSGPKVCVV
jgi:hypothetical protein